MTQLSVNVNKLATLRNSRGKNNPDVVQGAIDLVRFGSHGITVHPRPDERHIRRSDVGALKKALTPHPDGKTIELNVEGYPAEDFLQLIDETKPAQVTLVPDPPEALTSNAGWSVEANRELLAKVSARIKKSGARVSVFVDPETMRDEDYKTLRGIGVDRVELYTERYAETHGKDGGEKVLANYERAAKLAKDNGLGVNAGHDLSLENLAALVQRIPWIDEVSIGHALICDALYLGFEETVRRYLGCLGHEG